jgi:hypothetical protein
MKIKLVKESKFDRSSLKVETQYWVYANDKIEVLTTDKKEAYRVYEAYKANYVPPVEEILESYETN